MWEMSSKAKRLLLQVTTSWSKRCIQGKGRLRNRYSRVWLATAACGFAGEARWGSGEEITIARMPVETRNVLLQTIQIWT